MEIKRFNSGSFDTNTYIIINKDECIIIDPTFNMGKVAEELKNNYKVKAILLTHGHLDHVDGIKYFTDLPIYIHKDEIDILKDSKYNLYFEYYGINNPFDVNKLNLITVSDNEVLNLIGLNIEVTYTPGHTKGGVCYKIEDKLFTGDTLFLNSIGRWDFPTGNYCVLMNSIRKIMYKYKDNLLCYPGHDEIGELNYIRRNNSFVLEALK